MKFLSVTAAFLILCTTMLQAQDTPPQEPQYPSLTLNTPQKVDFPVSPQFGRQVFKMEVAQKLDYFFLFKFLKTDDPNNFFFEIHSESGPPVKTAKIEGMEKINLEKGKYLLVIASVFPIRKENSLEVRWLDKEPEPQTPPAN